MGILKYFKLYLYLIVINSLFIAFSYAEELSWPRELQLESGVLTIYQPQVDDLEKDILSFRAAVSFKER